MVDDEALNSGSLDDVILDFTLTTSPYPSTLGVSGIPGTVTDVDVVLDGISGGDADYLDLLLVGPQGQQTVLASDAGNSLSIPGGTVFTLDDEAATVLPENQGLVSGRFQPVNYADGIFGTETDSYPAPAPAATTASELSAFDGTDPNGTWRLFGTGDTMGTEIPIGSWSLDIEYADNAAPSGSVSIGGGALTSTSSTVPVTLGGTDPVPGTGVAQVRFSNDGGNTWSPFRPFATHDTWTLATGDGDRTVTVQVADGAGNLSAPVSDSIRVDPPARGGHPQAREGRHRCQDDQRGQGLLHRDARTRQLEGLHPDPPRQGQRQEDPGQGRLQVSQVAPETGLPNGTSSPTRSTRSPWPPGRRT